jgi:uncharacterized membrane protein
MADSQGDSRTPSTTIPSDLLAVLAILVITDLSLIAPVVRDTPLRVVTGFVVLLFLPGYTLVSVLFPEGTRPTKLDADAESRNEADQQRGIDAIERVTFAIAFSLVLVMAIALGLDTVGIPIGLESTLVVINGLVVALTGFAAYRRRQLPPDDQFRPAFDGVIDGMLAEVREFTRLDRVLAIAFVVLLVSVGAGAAYTVVVPSEEERYTELYLLSENKDGNLTAADYPTEFTVNESEALTVGVENHEFKRTNYTLIVELQNVSRRSADASVNSKRELHRSSIEIEHDEQWQRRHVITTHEPRQNLRLQFLLYRGAPPTDPTRENAYRHAHLWITSSVEQQ